MIIKRLRSLVVVQDSDGGRAPSAGRDGSIIMGPSVPPARRDRHPERLILFLDVVPHIPLAAHSVEARAKVERGTGD